jgi:hypothetical protein
MAETLRDVLRTKEEDVTEVERDLDQTLASIAAAQRRGDVSATEAAEFGRQVSCARQNLQTARAWLRDGQAVPSPMLGTAKRLVRSLAHELGAAAERRRMALPVWQRAAQERAGKLAEIRAQEQQVQDYTAAARAARVRAIRLNELQR